jgi:hypothetical protein
MAHPKAMYKQTSTGMTQEVAMSPDEQSEFAGKGWSPHPEDARLAFKNAKKEKPEVKEERKPLIDMTKKELEVYARTLGVELDRRKTKANMMKELEEMLQ